MSKNWVGAVVVLALAIGLVVWRESQRPTSPGVKSSQPQADAQVVLFADLSETDEVEGCGAIIRAVRKAAQHGITTLEIDPRYPSELAKRYRLLVAPTVIFFEGTNQETLRYEGEAPETVRAIEARIDRLLSWP